MLKACLAETGEIPKVRWTPHDLRRTVATRIAEQLGIELAERDFHDILLSIPGVSYSGEESGLSRYSIRGISTTASNPTVGIYLNDVSLVTLSTNFAGAVDPVLVDLERVEVLKGPQGTLYGGSAMGVAIKYVTRNPILHQFAVTAAGELASIDHGSISYSGESFINLPLIDNGFALRLGGKQCGFKSWERPSAAEIRSGSAALQPGVDEMWTSLSERTLTSPYARHMLTSMWSENTQ